VRVSWRSVGAARLPSLCSTPGCAPAPPLRASTPIACHRHVPCTTQSAPPAWLCVARSSSAIGFAILDERSSLSPGKRLHHQRSSSSHDASPHPQGDPLKFGISTKDSTRRRAHAPYSAPLWSSAPNALPHSAPLHSARPATPPLRASTPIACHRHVPCTHLAPPAWLCVARSTSRLGSQYPIGFAILSERSSKKFGISAKECTRRRAHLTALRSEALLPPLCPTPLPSTPLAPPRSPAPRQHDYQSCSLHILSASSPASLATSSSSTSSPAPSSSSPASSSSSSTPPPRKSSISGASPVSPKRWFAAC
jgi:hypothetical protein